MDEPILVAVAGAHDIVEAGLRTLLAEACGVVVMTRFPDFGTVPDVIVYDAIGIELDGGAEVTAFAKESESAVVVMSRDQRPDLAARALARGASGYFSIECGRAEVIAMIQAAARGDLESLAGDPRGIGAEAGLTRREVDVLGAVVLGMSNHEIGELLSLSANTIKSYIRSAYRKMGVHTRAQAVAWCLARGFEPPAPAP
jgi:DNA-binding NarL/FixJ family response regulator